MGREELRRKWAFEGLMSWSSKLFEVLKNVDLPEKLKPSAAVVPALFMNTMIGCAPGKIVECTESQAGLIQASRDYYVDHTDEIQAEYAQLQPGVRVTAQDISDTLYTAEIHCTTDRRRHVEDGTSGVEYRNEIYVFVDEGAFKDAVEAYEIGGWTAEYSLEELAQVAHVDEAYAKYKDDLIKYYAALYEGVGLLGHEASHLIMGSHDKEIEKELEDTVELDKDALTDLAKKDPMYAWSLAGRNAVTDTTTESLDLYRGYYQQQSI